MSTNTHTVGEIWWRLEAGRGCDAPHVELRWMEYRVTRVTPKGVWLVPHAFFAPVYTPRFALLGASRWVSPTKGEAAIRFSARKRRQIAICRSQLDDAEEALDLVRAWSAA